MAYDPFDGFGGQWGYQTDRDTGLVLCGQHYYDPATGQRLTRDPIGYDGGINLYSYVGSNPIMGMDPSGLDPIIVHATTFEGNQTGKTYYIDLPRGTNDVKAIVDDIVNNSHAPHGDGLFTQVKPATEMIRPFIGNNGKYDFHNKFPYDELDKKYAAYYRAKLMSSCDNTSLGDARGRAGNFIIGVVGQRLGWDVHLTFNGGHAYHDRDTKVVKYLDQLGWRVSNHSADEQQAILDGWNWAAANP